LGVNIIHEILQGKIGKTVKKSVLKDSCHCISFQLFSLGGANIKAWVVVYSADSRIGICRTCDCGRSQWFWMFLFFVNTTHVL